MTVFKFILWFVLTAAVYGGLFAAWFPLRKKNKRWISIVGIVAQVLLATFAAYICIASSTLLPRLVQCFLAMLYTALLADAVTELVFLIIGLFKKSGFKPFVRFEAGMALTIGYLAFMVINSQVVTANFHTYSSDKLTDDHTFVFLADLHYGNTQSRDVVERTFDKIKSENPEFIVLGGDITDEFTSKEDMETVYKMIGALDIPTYYVYGNHDRQNHSDDVGGRTYTDSELESAIISNGIHILQDEYVELGDIVLLGREDYDCDKRIAVSDLKARPDGKYVINIDHSPYQYEDIKDTNADLQLSGHVHAAQLFPLRALYALSVQNIYGEYRSLQTDICVSSGVSGWCFPLRSEAFSHYEVVHLEKQ